MAVELSLIASIEDRYIETPRLSTATQVMVGGALVPAAGIAIGSG